MDRADGSRASLGDMVGAIAIVVVLLLIPVMVLITGGIGSAIIGYALQRDGEIRNEGSELLALDD